MQITDMDKIMNMLDYACRACGVTMQQARCQSCRQRSVVTARMLFSLIAERHGLLDREIACALSMSRMAASRYRFSLKEAQRFSRERFIFITKKTDEYDATT